MTETSTPTPPPGFDFFISIDRKPIPARKDDTILKAALRAGAFIPHYCWHPGLTIAGNCRICLVYATQAGPPNKPVIACNTQVVQGMEVESDGPRTKLAREGVMEFLLINHPLDCPVCDQAGECDLQQYSFDYGRETSPFVEEKTQRHRKDLGPNIRFAGNRCIVCTRCVRFTEEITGTGELCVVQRGDQSVIDVFPGLELDNPISTCVADICPVGALLDRDSIHSTRVWLLRGTKSVCGGCATGCNVNLETWREEVRRITPRENQAANRWWMCDRGRLLYKEASAPERVTAARVDGAAHAVAPALEALVARIKALGPRARLGAVASGFSTNEELHLLRTLVGEGPVAAGFAPEGPEWTARDGFHVAADRNPNRAGFERVIGDASPTSLAAAVEQLAAVDLLLVHDAIPGGGPWEPALVEAARRAKLRVVFTLAETPLSEGAEFVFPALHWVEKDGTVVNRRGRLQRLRPATPPPGDARPDLELLQELARALGKQPRVLSAAGVFKRLAAAAPVHFQGLTYNEVGLAGVPLPGAEDTLPRDQARTYYEAGPHSRSPGRANDEQTRVSVHREHPIGTGTPRGDY